MRITLRVVSRFRLSPVPRVSPAPVPFDALPCPECRLRGHGGQARIGNRRNSCETCNNWAQNIARMTGRELRQMHPDDYLAIRARIEADRYPLVIEDFVLSHPETRRPDDDF